MLKESINPATDPGNTALVIIQTLFCVLREKNVLTRADMEELCLKLEDRVANHAKDPLPCCAEAAAAAASEMANICEYIGHKFGGKHSREYWRR
jgi:hypothetical protein